VRFPARGVTHPWHSRDTTFGSEMRFYPPPDLVLPPGGGVSLWRRGLAGVAGGMFLREK